MKEARRARIQLTVAGVAIAASGLTETEHVDSRGNRVTRLRDRFGRWASRSEGDGGTVSEVASKINVDDVMEKALPEGVASLEGENPADMRDRATSFLANITTSLSSILTDAGGALEDVTSNIADKISLFDSPQAIVSLAKAGMEELRENPLGVLVFAGCLAVMPYKSVFSLSLKAIPWQHRFVTLAAGFSGYQVFKDTFDFFKDAETIRKNPQLREIKREIDEKQEKFVDEFLEENRVDDRFLARTSVGADDIKRVVSGMEREYDKLMFLNRVKELSEMVRDGERGDGFEWRVGVLRSEVKYGEFVNKITSPLKARKGDYDDLIEELKKNKRGDVKCDIDTYPRLLDKKPLKLFSRKDLAAILSDPEASFAQKTVARYRLKNLEVEKRALEDVAKMSNIREKISLSAALPNLKLGGYNQQILGKPHIAIVGTFATGILPGRNIVYHEFGHVVEHRANLVAQSTDYIKQRDKERSSILRDGDKKRQSSNWIMSYQRLDHDADFYRDYASTTYVGGHSTEVVSTGLEKLSSPSDLKGLAEHDREHLMYVLYALDKT